jgi:septal ring factor EnvC (AmiA/AmiB activator)
MNFLRFILILIVVLLVPYAAASQTDNQPSGNLQSAEPKVCVSQEAANKCAENARLIPALNEKIAALEAKIKAHETTIEELKEVNRKNVADLTDRLHKTELSLATKTGEIIGCQAQNVEQRAIIQALLPMVKKKRNALITIF